MLIWLEAILMFLVMIGYSCAFIWAVERFRECLWWDGFDIFSTAAITFIWLAGLALLYGFHNFLSGGTLCLG